MRQPRCLSPTGAPSRWSPSASATSSSIRSGSRCSTRCGSADQRSPAFFRPLGAAALVLLGLALLLVLDLLPTLAQRLGHRAAGGRLGCGACRALIASRIVPVPAARSFAASEPRRPAEVPIEIIRHGIGGLPLR